HEQPKRIVFLYDYTGATAIARAYLSIDDQAGVWRCALRMGERFDGGRGDVPCALGANVNSKEFARILKLRADADVGEMVTRGSGCRDCGTITIEEFTPRDPGHPALLATDGEIAKRRSSQAADTILRWLLAIERDAPQADES